MKRREIDWFIRYDGKMHGMDNLNWLERYFTEIQNAQEKYHADLKIKAGIEVGYEPGREEYIEHILNNFPFDFVLGAVHCLDHVAISSKKECSDYFLQKTSIQVATDYFIKLKLAVQSRLFDCIAHIDLYRRYGRSYLGSSIEDLHIGHIEEIFYLMAKYQIGMEINTSGLRRGLDDLHPSSDILHIAIQNGVEYFTMGSDAHSLSEIGQGLTKAEKLLKKFQCSVTTFTRRKPDSLIRVDKPTTLP